MVALLTVTEEDEVRFLCPGPKYGRVAQSGEHRADNSEVAGS